MESQAPNTEKLVFLGHTGIDGHGRCLRQMFYSYTMLNTLKYQCEDTVMFFLNSTHCKIFNTRKYSRDNYTAGGRVYLDDFGWFWMAVPASKSRSEQELGTLAGDLMGTNCYLA